ncbi:hypothetical protein IJS77_02855 [bacterium]|nr:hypothetical protein [bacterium]
MQKINLFCSNQNTSKPAFGKLSFLTRLSAKTPSATDTFEKAIKDSLEEAKKSKIEERFLSVLRRISNSKVISQKEMNNLLNGLSKIEKLKLSDLVSRFNYKISDLSVSLAIKFPSEGKKLTDRMMDIALNGSEVIQNLLK